MKKKDKTETSKPKKPIDYHKKILKLKKLIEELMCGIEEEMEHGKYQTPEFVPDEFSNEEDYYERHEEIVDYVVEKKVALRKFLKSVH